MVKVLPIVLVASMAALFVPITTAKTTATTPECGPNEYFNNCGGCDNLCSEYGPTMCPQLCGENGACRCDTGFARNEEGECIPREQCPALPCGKNEVFEVCGGCEHYCNEEEPICSLGCTHGACVCAPGFYRDYLDGKNECAKTEECPKNTNF
ncbi:hypothetical protein L596_012955 [Steinernema carpocapsae]|uniref:TIL domain-containing protein n=1 Tax=Steinernema carpocapsae TaxID=34508 RepID=A0A4U5NZ77_STECR|nr:hypothetical protein L596_012955 [Steinernema carpocapsae]